MPRIAALSSWASTTRRNPCQTISRCAASYPFGTRLRRQTRSTRRSQTERDKGEAVANGAPSGVNKPFYSTPADGGSTFRYNPETGEYILNLCTKSLDSSTIYRIHADIIGGLMDTWIDVARE